MQYMLMLYSDETGWDRLTADEQRGWMEAYAAYSKALAEAGVLRGGNHLQSFSQSKTVRVKEGKSRVTDGPFIETKEHLGGYFLIDVPDIAAALSWAERCPAARHGVVEVRACGAPPSPADG